MSDNSPLNTLDIVDVAGGACGYTESNLVR